MNCDQDMEKPPPAAPSQPSETKLQKRNRQSDCFHEELTDTDTGETVEDRSSRHQWQAKKPRENSATPTAAEEEAINDSDSDYDDIDEIGTPSDIDDFDEDGIAEDDQSTASTRTTISTGSVGSNTPSLIGENLESFSLGEGGEKAKATTWIGGPQIKTSVHPLRRSLFSHCPPCVNFVHHNEIPEISLPAEIRKQLRWKLSTITPAVVKKIVTNSGYRLMRKTSTEWCATWGKHMKSPQFKDIDSSQKLNHFPGTFNIGRKDRLWRNYHKMKLRFPQDDLSFLPRTFCLPQDTKLLRKAWEKRGARSKWIVKPPALARGNGIKVINRWNQIPKSRPLIVQKYLAKPHLINNTKYDLRIYVLMTSVNPLRIYLYDEGLVRFASNKYTTDADTLNDVFMHLTNYSINKNSSSYCHNEDADVRQGHKWTLASLWQHFNEHGIDSKPVWERIKDLVIKTIISAENAMNQLYRANLSSHYSVYELFGFDVLLDHQLKPWLIEVNISPSLHSASPLDLDVKSPLATEVFNIARYHLPSKMTQKKQREILEKLGLGDLTTLCLDRRLYARELSKVDKAKQDSFIEKTREEYMDAILENLTPDDVRFLIRAEDELTQVQHFERIFPTQDTYKYFKYLEKPRYYNKLFDAWEQKFGECRAAGVDRLELLCQAKHHLKVPNTFQKNSKQPIDVSVLKAPTGEVGQNEVQQTVTVEDAPQAQSTESPKASSTVKASKIGFTAKPYGLTTQIVPPGRRISKTKQSSPERMSVGPDPESDRNSSRSPSPEQAKDILDNVTSSTLIGGTKSETTLSNSTTSTLTSTSTSDVERLDNRYASDHENANLV